MWWKGGDARFLVLKWVLQAAGLQAVVARTFYLLAPLICQRVGPLILDKRRQQIAAWTGCECY